MLVTVKWCWFRKGILSLQNLWNNSGLWIWLLNLPRVFIKTMGLFWDDSTWSTIRTLLNEKINAWRLTGSKSLGDGSGFSHFFKGCFSWLWQTLLRGWLVAMKRRSDSRSCDGSRYSKRFEEAGRCIALALSMGGFCYTTRWGFAGPLIRDLELKFFLEAEVFLWF